MIDLELSGLNRFTRITTIANMKPIFCRENESIDSVVGKIINSNHRSIVVVDSKQKITGIVTAAEILDSFLIGQEFSLPISGIMHRDVLTVESDNTIGYVLQKFKMSRRGRFPVKRENKLVGIVGENDIVKFFSNLNFETKIESIMTKKPLFLNMTNSILNAMKSIVSSHYRRLPVVDGGKLIGLVMANDMLKLLKERNYRFGLLQNPISTVMIKNVITAKKEEDVSVAVKMMLVHEIDGVVVADNQKLEGIITERNILEQIN